MLRATFVALALAAGLCGCVNPNAIGLQDYNSIVGRVIDAKTNGPISGALVSATGSNNPVYTSSDGSFMINMVAIGPQSVTASAAGYVTQSVTVNVLKGGPASQAGLIALPPAT